jgi:hypothetical protein
MRPVKLEDRNVPGQRVLPESAAKIRVVEDDHIGRFRRSGFRD